MANMSRLIIGKPKKVISSYNIFYRLARKIMISSMSQSEKEAGEFTSDTIFLMNNDTLMKMSLNIIKEYRYGVVEKKRKTKCLSLQGIVNLKDLTRIISAQWNKLSQSSRIIFEICSNKDKTTYTELCHIWNKENDAIIKQLLVQDIPQEKSESSCPSSILNEKSIDNIPSEAMSNTSELPTQGVIRLISNDSSLFNSSHSSFTLPQVKSNLSPRFLSYKEECLQNPTLYSQRDLLSNTLVGTSDGFSKQRTESNFQDLRKILLKEVFDDERDLHSFFLALR